MRYISFKNYYYLLCYTIYSYITYHLDKCILMCFKMQTVREAEINTCNGDFYRYELWFAFATVRTSVALYLDMIA